MPFLTSGRSRFIGGGRVPPAPVPVVGADVIVNGNFSAWTGDDPDGWSVAGETATRIVSQVGNGEGYGGGGTGACNFWVDFLQSTSIRQSGLTAHRWYLVAMLVDTVISGSVQAINGNGTFVFVYYTPGSKLCCLRTNDTQIVINTRSHNSDITIDDVSVLPLILSSLISVRPYASADCDISVAVTRTDNTQAGISARVDSAASPANFLIAYLNGTSGVRVDKCVAGVYTNVITGAVTYAAGRILRLVCNGDNVSAYYNGAQVGTTQTVSDAGIVGNKNHGLFSTYSANTFSGYVAA